MNYNATTPEEYIKLIPEDRKPIFKKLRAVINEHIPEGFEEGIQYKMIGWYVPHSVYPFGYHCDPKTPLPFMNLASQKNFIALYHSGIYADKKLNDWFINEFPKHAKRKLDMGKSCIRFKYLDDIPYDLIGQLAAKMSSEEWISIYEASTKNK
ncbi:DUF1801 domain-containing protein [Aegicerativicinus sediminis]